MSEGRSEGRGDGGEGSNVERVSEGRSVRATRARLRGRSSVRRSKRRSEGERRSDGEQGVRASVRANSLSVLSSQCVNVHGRAVERSSGRRSIGRSGRRRRRGNEQQVVGERVMNEGDG